MTPANEEQLLKDVGEIKGTLVSHTPMLESLNVSINGNGKPGLKTMVAEHEVTLCNIKRVLWVVATPVLAAVGGGLVTAAVWLIHLVH